jgi:hypothetical protein
MMSLRVLSQLKSSSMKRGLATRMVIRGRSLRRGQFQFLLMRRSLRFAFQMFFVG